jgi:hypothetical protein
LSQPKLFSEASANATLIMPIRNELATQYLPVCKILNSNSGRYQFASGEFGLCTNYASNLIDDSRLGFHSGKKPDIFVLDHRYIEGIDIEPVTSDFRIYAKNLIDSSVLIYSNSKYQVFRYSKK